MADQAPIGQPTSTLRENGHPSAAAGVRDNLGEILSDMVTLGELQAKLLAVDARESMHKAQTPIVMLVVGAVLGLGAVPVLLMSLGEALALLFDWNNPENYRSLGYLLSGVIGAAAGGLLMWLAWRQTGDIVKVFLRSTSELSENIRWIKYALTRGRRPPR